MLSETEPPERRRRTASWPACAWIVLEKDLRLELATGEIVTTSGFFAVLVAVIASLAFSASVDPATSVAPGVIWVAVAFASVLILGRTWQRERDDGAIQRLLMSPLPRSAIFAGKALGVCVFLLVVELVVVPAAALFFSIDLVAKGPMLAVICLVATPGIAATGTLFGAMSVRTGARELIVASVLFPLIAPSLLVAVAGTRELLAGASPRELLDYLGLMTVFGVVFTAGGLGLFELLMEA